MLENLINFIKIILWGGIIVLCWNIAEKHHLNKFWAIFLGTFFAPFALVGYYLYGRHLDKKLSKETIKD